VAPPQLPAAQVTQPELPQQQVVPVPQPSEAVAAAPPSHQEVVPLAPQAAAASSVTRRPSKRNLPDGAPESSTKRSWPSTPFGSPTDSPGASGSGEEDAEEKMHAKFMRMGRSLLLGCRTVDRFRKLNRIDEGTYGVVYRARDLETEEVIALKQLKLSAAKSDDGFPVPSLREVFILSKLDHINVVSLLEVVVGHTPLHIFMVMEYAEHELRALLERHTFSVAEAKCLIKQLLSGVAHLHERWVIHRDLKTSNILLTNSGVLKVADFGLARHFGDPLRPMTKNVITMWYRAPELLMGQRQYTTAVDVWSTGCVFAEIFLRKPVFAGKSELHQLTLIYELTGVPTEDSWPGYESLPNRKNFLLKQSLPRWRTVFPEPPESLVSNMGLELLRRLLTCCPERRVTAEASIEDPYFWERPYALDLAMMPTYTDTNMTGRGSQRSPTRHAASLVDLKKRGLLGR
jgi:cell division cycle 2-like protein